MGGSFLQRAEWGLGYYLSINFMGGSTCFRPVFSVALMQPPHLTTIILSSLHSAKPYSTPSPSQKFFRMEIDFMGLLYPQNPAPPNGDSFVDSGIESGEGNVSLSLCTSSLMEEKAAFQDFLRKKIRKAPAENMASTQNLASSYDWENAQPRERSSPTLVGKPVIIHSVFLYNRDDRPTIFRNKFERPLSFPSSSTVFCPNTALIAQKADRKMYATGDASFDDARKSKDGYTPTVAMARRATLARFLKKRSHRLNQQTKPHLKGLWEGY